MVSKEEILNSLQFVSDNSQYVSISREAVERYVANFTPLKTLHWSKIYPLGYQPRKNLEDEIDFNFLIGNQAFCYWSKNPPKWTVEYKNKKLDGWWAAIACFERALEKGVPILDGHYLKEITLKEAEELFDGEPEIPLLRERFEMLKKIGEVLVKNYDSRFHNFLEQASKNSIALTEEIAESFPGFDDTSIYKGRKIYFYKKAQVVVKDLAYFLPDIVNIEDLPGTADYKIPAVLRKFGILVYNPELALRVDKREEIEEGSEMEIEIRANQLQAVQEIWKEIRLKYPEISPIILHEILWIQSQEKGFLDKPYHLTRTIYY